MKVLGKEFQAEGAEKQKLWVPNRLDRVHGMRSISKVEERKKYFKRGIYLGAKE